MNKYIKNIILTFIALILFFGLSYFVSASIGIAHLVLVSAATYAIALNILALTRR